MITYRCECGTTYRLSDEKVGAKVKCRACGRKGIVEAPESPSGPRRSRRKGVELDRATLSWLIVGVGITICIVLATAGYIVSMARSSRSASRIPATAQDTAPAGDSLPQAKQVGEGRTQRKAGLGRGPHSAQPPTAGGNAALTGKRRAGLSSEALFAKASPAVARVVVRDDRFRLIKQGSGFFVTADGVLVTNRHVIDGAHFAQVMRTDGSSYFVEAIVAEDSEADLALLQVNGHDLPHLEISRGDLPPVGAHVFAIGSPQGLPNTLSDGIISGHRRVAEQLTLLQTTAAISHGSSGGPLLSAKGEVVGVTTMYLATGQNLNFAVPADRLARLVSAKREPRALASAGGRPAGPQDTKTLDAVWRAISRKEYGKALRLLAELRESQQESEAYWLAVGYVQDALGNHELAMDALRNALRLKPDMAIAHLNMGVVLSRSRQIGGAIECYKRAIQLDPSCKLAYMNMGLAYAAQRKYESAIAAHKSAIAIDPGYLRAHCRLAFSYLLLKKPRDALAAARAAMSCGVEEGQRSAPVGLRLEASLLQTASFEFDDTPFLVVLDELDDVSLAKVRADPTAVASPFRLIRFRARNMMLRHALSWVGRLADLECGTKGDCIWLTSSERVGVRLPPEGAEARASWHRHVSAALGKRVRVDFRDTPLMDILDYLSALADVTILLDPKSQGRVREKLTVRTADVPLDEALRVVCGLAFAEYMLKDGAVFVAPPDVIARERQEQEQHEAKGHHPPAHDGEDTSRAQEGDAVRVGRAEPFAARQFRSQLVGQRGGPTKKSEAAVERGLKWLANSQLPTGAWRTDRELSRWADPGVTGLATLAFLGAGHTHKQGRYDEVVRRALAYFKEQQDTEGCIGRKGAMARTGHMYNHGIATLALVEAYAMTKDDALREPATRAVGFISRAQNSSGGWRYYFNSADADASVGGWMVSALHTARLAGLAVPDRTWQGARKFFDSVTNREKGYTSYMAGMQPSSAALVAVGLLCNQYLGEEDNSGYVKLASKAILQFPPRWVILTERDRMELENMAVRSPGANDYYFWYYASLALHQGRGWEWAEWHPKVRETLIKAQVRDGEDHGSWPPLSRWSVRGGRVYSTAMAILALEVYYRSVPAHQHD